MDMAATAHLEHVAITTFAVDPRAIARRLPAGVVPEVVALHTGPAALVSAVSFLVRDLHLHRFARPRVTCGHVDYRAYVRHGAVPGVWFLGAAMDSRLAAVPRLLWRMPWRRATVTIDAPDRGAYRLTGTARLAVDFDGGAARPLDGFPSLADAAATLVNPCVGLYRRGRAIGRYAVSHGPLEPVATATEVHEAAFPAFDGLDGRLHSVLLLPPFPITIHLPPTSLGPPRAHR